MRLLLCILFGAWAGAAQAADRLPKSVLGKWASDPAACKEQSSELGLTVEPRSVLFYEHGYEVRRVSRLNDGSWKASGYAVDLDGRARGSVVLKLLAADRLQAGSEIYHRCEQQSRRAP